MGFITISEQILDDVTDIVNCNEAWSLCELWNCRIVYFIVYFLMFFYI